MLTNGVPFKSQVIDDAMKVVRKYYLLQIEGEHQAMEVSVNSFLLKNNCLRLCDADLSKDHGYI